MEARRREGDNMIRNAIRFVTAIGVVLLTRGILGADANTWTGGRPVVTAEWDLTIVAADPGDPDVVYGAFGPGLYRSDDGGRTWRFLESFGAIQAVLVHPASPSTIYVAASVVYKSTDAGETWSATSVGYANSLAGSPTDASTVYAGTFDWIYKTTDGGANWSAVEYWGVVADLVIDPRDPTVSYAAVEGYEYFGDYPGSLVKSTDGGTHWLKSSPEGIDSALAVAVDSVATSTVYMTTGPYRWGEGAGAAPDVLRSDDGGSSWTSAGTGLPSGSVRSLAVDPLISGTVYAGTEAGVYRSRDGGRSWTSFSQRLAGMPITSLAIDGTGRRLHASTSSGVYDLELAIGPMDVTEGPAGASRVLVWDGEAAALGALDASGDWTSTPPGNASATWTAIAIATAPGGDRTHILWQNGDGRTSLEILGPSGRLSASVFAARPGWIASDLSVRPDGTTNILWSGPDGRMSVANYDSHGATNGGPEYGPAPGWSAVSIADGSGDDTWVLWRSSGGRWALSAHRFGRMMASHNYGAHLDWSAQDLAVATDGRPRVLRTSPAGLASVVTIDSRGGLSAGQRYTLPGFTPRRIAAGADGQARLLFGSDDGQGELLVLNADNTLSAKHALRPLASIVVTTTSELEAALAPANSGRQILVRAGDYEIGHALTVPDRATLVGEGDMHFDTSGLPSGFASSGRARLLGTPDLVGDILTLGDGSTIRNLVIEDAAGRQSGNLVVVSSRAPDDFVSAAVARCEFVNPNPAGIIPQGSTGRSLVAVTRNHNLGEDPPPHEGSALSISMKDSIVRSPGAGYGVFAINFASQSQIRLRLERNVVGGGVNASGGVSRPDAVTGASVTIRSEGNLYRSDSVEPTLNGWSFIGGTTAPIPGLASEASTSNLLRMRSRDDRIEAFARGISATGGVRTSDVSEPSSSNRIDLDANGLRIDSTAADLVLAGAQSLVESVSPGDANIVRFRLGQATGSGPRANVYTDSVMGLGVGNALEVVGTEGAFVGSNEDFDPIPPAEFFDAAE
jgi:photosystem II stability/assembly factor-like uncharacterized protein